MPGIGQHDVTSEDSTQPATNVWVHRSLSRRRDGADCVWFETCSYIKRGAQVCGVRHQWKLRCECQGSDMTLLIKIRRSPRRTSEYIDRFLKYSWSFEVPFDQWKEERSLFWLTDDDSADHVLIPRPSYTISGRNYLIVCPENINLSTTAPMPMTFFSRIAWHFLVMLMPTWRFP